MAKIKEKEIALVLRRNGESIQKIAEKIKVSKSTVSLWCRNIILKKWQIKQLVKNQQVGSYRGRIISAEIKRQARIQEESVLRIKGIKEIGKIKKRDLFIAGVAMYLSEGYTSSNESRVGFVNSDPKVILLMLKWFKEICQIPKERIILSIRINKNQKNRIDAVEKYWSQVTKIPLSQFNRTVLINAKSKKVFSNSENYFGTLRIIIRQSTKLRRIINGWVEGLLREK